MSSRRTLEQLTMVELQPLHQAFDPRYPDSLRKIAEVLYMRLVDCGPGMPLPQLAVELTEALSLHFGGFYVNKGHSYRKRLAQAPRDQEIASAVHSGLDIDLVARKNGITPMRVRQIVDEWDRNLFEKRQQTMAGIPTRADAERAAKQAAKAGKGPHMDMFSQPAQRLQE